MYLEIGTQLLKMHLFLDFPDILQIKKLVVKDYPYEYSSGRTCIADHTKVKGKASYA